MKTVIDLDSINFSDCPIYDMTVNFYEKEVQVVFNYLYVNTSGQWEAVDQLTLILSDWQKLVVEKFQDNTWMLLDSAKPETFKEIHEVSRQDNQLILEGFSAQSGYWLKYIFLGDLISAAVNAQEMV